MNIETVLPDGESLSLDSGVKIYSINAAVKRKAFDLQPVVRVSQVYGVSPVCYANLFNNYRFLIIQLESC
jgi:hypothetical protein